MVLQRAFTAVSFLIFLVPEDSLSYNGFQFPQSSVQSCTKPTYLSKVYLNQTGYVQSIQYSAPVPELRNSFTTSFWLNLDNVTRNATVLSYALSRQQLDTLVLKYVGGGTMPLWELTLTGRVVFSQPVPPPGQGQWFHITVTWNAYRDTWEIYQDGRLSGAGNSLQVVDYPVSGGGTVVIGALQTTLVNGMDQGEGVVGWITHFYLHSQPISQHEYFKKVWPGRCFRDMPAFNDIIDWVHTPHKLVGGATEVKASISCGAF